MLTKRVTNVNSTTAAGMAGYGERSYDSERQAIPGALRYLYRVNNRKHHPCSDESVADDGFIAEEHPFFLVDEFFSDIA